jgi:hypothetical protein
MVNPQLWGVLGGTFELVGSAGHQRCDGDAPIYQGGSLLFVFHPPRPSA